MVYTSATSPKFYLQAEPQPRMVETQRWHYSVPKPTHFHFLQVAHVPTSPLRQHLLIHPKVSREYFLHTSKPPDLMAPKRVQKRRLPQQPKLPHAPPPIRAAIPTIPRAARRGIHRQAAETIRVDTPKVSTAALGLGH